MTILTEKRKGVVDSGVAPRSTDGCDHDYQTVYEDSEMERRECTKCGDRYALYDDEMS